MATKAMSAMAIDSTIAGTERLLAQGADGSVILVSAISAYVIDDLIDSTAATPTAGDYLLGFRGTDEKKMTLDTVASYAVASAWTVASEADPALTGDMLLANRSGTVYELDIDTITTYALVGIQATVLNTSALGAATLSADGSTDTFAICQTGSPTVPVTLALDDLETRLWTDYTAYVTALSAVVTSVDADTFYVLQGGVAKKVTATVLATYMSAEIIGIGTVQTSSNAALAAYLTALDAVGTVANTDLLYCTQSGVAKKLTLLELATYAVENALELPWTEIPSGSYTATPASTSTITMSDTSDFAIGLPVKYMYGGQTYYGIVTGVNSNALLTIAGAPLVVASPLSALYVGMASGVTQMDFVVDDFYEDAVQDIFSAVTSEYHRWGKSAAYLVQFSATHGVADTGVAQPKINVKVNASVVSTNDTSKGLQLSATPGTWVNSSAIAIDTATYKIERGEAIELRCTEAGTNGDADVLTVTCIFVSE